MVTEKEVNEYLAEVEQQLANQYKVPGAKKAKVAELQSLIAGNLAEIARMEMQNLKWAAEIKEVQAA